MNADFEYVKSILIQIRSEYLSGFANDKVVADIPITERDIVSEICNRLKLFCLNKNLSSHTEIKPAASILSDNSELKLLPRVDNVILKNIGERTWISEAIILQDKYKKGPIEARFSSIPIVFFHTAIEIKIQSNFRDAKKDIDKLKVIQNANKDCNCFFVLLNVRGQKRDHDLINKYAEEQNLCIIEYTGDKKNNQIIENHTRHHKIVRNNKVKNFVIPRRRRIIDLINQNCNDNEILRVLDNEYPIGTFKTSNYAALYGTKRDLGLKVLI